MKKNYHTEGRDALIEFLSRNPDRQFTVDELCLEVRGSAEIGKSSIYRQLGALCAEESVRRFYSEEQKRALYQYVGRACDCSRHFHEKSATLGVRRFAFVCRAFVKGSRFFNRLRTIDPLRRLRKMSRGRGRLLNDRVVVTYR